MHEPVGDPEQPHFVEQISQHTESFSATGCSLSLCSGAEPKDGGLEECCANSENTKTHTKVGSEFPVVNEFGVVVQIYIYMPYKYSRSL